MLFDSIPSNHQSIFYMTLAMSVHFFGYELIRNTSMSLFTSSKINLPKIAHPLVMSTLSPFSTCLLLWYGGILRYHGPRIALRYTSLLTLCVWVAFGGILLFFSEDWIRIKQGIVILSFLFQHTYVYLLSTQYWSFIGSVLSQEDNAAVWFSAISGVSSITSTIAASSVSFLLKYYPLEGLLCLAGCIVVISLLLSEAAFSLANYSPEETETKKKNDQTVKAAIQLFRRVPILGALFLEEVIFQCLVTISNVCFVTKLKSSSSKISDVDRATWTGHYFGLINGLSSVFQFVIIPFFLAQHNATWVRRSLPIFAIVSCVLLSFSSHPSLLTSSIPFFLIKLTDYSVRGVLNQMVYLPLDFESRYLGKEIVGVLASRFGKSGMSIVLFFFTMFFSMQYGLRTLSFISTFMAFLWCLASFRLSSFIDGSNDGKHVDLKEKKQ